MRAGSLPASWDVGLPQALESLYCALPMVRGWTPLDGWKGAEEMVGNPFPSAYLLALLLLSRLPENAWVRPEAIEAWLSAQHPYWTNESLRPSRQKPWVGTFLLGMAFPLRLVLATKDEDGHRVRLSPTGRWLLGLGEMPTAPPVFAKTLLVQPNLEILAYRQGLTPTLIGRLTRFATWKTLGAACTMQLEPETVYRALEAGETFDSIRLALEQHGTRAIPPAVLDLLRTWSNKRDRITVFPSAALMEFASAEDLHEALSRGLPGIRVSDTVAVVPSEDAIEYRHFRLTGTRDYGLPPERCVHVEPDGLTLTVDLARSDLMLETELPRFAELIDRSGQNGKRQYRLTPASLAHGRSRGTVPGDPGDMVPAADWPAGQRRGPVAADRGTAGLPEPAPAPGLARRDSGTRRRPDAMAGDERADRRAPGTDGAGRDRRAHERAAAAAERVGDDGTGGVSCPHDGRHRSKTFRRHIGPGRR